MKNIKLSDYCKNNDISITTGYRRFKDNKIPGAFQNEAGNIFIPVEEISLPCNKDEATAMFLKKAFDALKNGISIGDFAIDVILNFDITFKKKENKQKPDMQEYYKKFCDDLKPNISKEVLDIAKKNRALIKKDLNISYDEQAEQYLSKSKDVQEEVLIEEHNNEIDDLFENVILTSADKRDKEE